MRLCSRAGRLALLLAGLLGVTGCHDDPFVTAPATPIVARRSPVPDPAPFQRTAAPLPAPEPLQPPAAGAPAAAPVVTGLELRPRRLTVAARQSIDLRASLQVLAVLSDGTREDVSRETLFDQPVGGTLSGNRFTPAAGSTSGALRVRIVRGAQRPAAVLEIAVLAPSAKLRSLALSPASATVTAGASYSLPANVQAIASFDDGSTADVSRSVRYERPAGGTLAGDGTFQAGPGIGSGSIAAVFSSGNTSATALFSFDVVARRPRPTSLAAIPAALTVAPGSRTSLRASIESRATFDDGSTADVSRDARFSDPISGALADDFFIAANENRPGSITVSFTADGVTVSRLVPISIAAPAEPDVVNLVIVSAPASISGPLDLRASIEVQAIFADGSSRDVSGEVTYADPAGGTLDVSVFTPSGGATTGGVTLVLGTARARAAFAFAGQAPRAVSLALSPPVVTVAAGSKLGLRESIGVSATFDDGSTRDVTRDVSYSQPTGGTLDGDVFAAGSSGGAGSVLVSFESPGAVVTARLGVVVQAATSRLVALDIFPTAVTLAAGGRFGLAANVRSTAAFDDASTRDVSREVTYGQAVGGTIVDGVFVAGSARGSGSVTVAYAEGADTRTAVLRFTILDQPASVPVALTVRTTRFAAQAGGALDLRSIVQSIATFHDGTVEDVTRDVVFTALSGGTLDGDRFEVAGDSSTGSVAVAFTRNGATVRATIAFPIARGTRVPQSLVLSPSRLSLLAGAPCELPVAARSIVRFHDGTTEDVTREAVYANPVNGTLEGRSFTAFHDVGTASVEVSFTRDGATARAALPMVVRPSRRRVTGLALSPTSVTIAAGGAFGLTANVLVTATFDDGTAATVLRGVDWSEPAGGRILATQAGFVFVPAVESGTGAATARYSEGGATASARLAIRIEGPGPAAAPLGLVLEPGQVTLGPGSTFDLHSNVKASVRRADGTLEDVTRNIRWVSPVGGTLRESALGPVYVAMAREGFGSVTAVLTEGTRTLAALLQIVVSEAGMQAKLLADAHVGEPYEAALGERLGPAFAYDARVDGAALASVGLSVGSDGRVRGVPTTAAVVGFTVAGGTTLPLCFDTVFVDVLPRVRLATPEPASGTEPAMPPDLDGDGLEDRLALEAEHVIGYFARPGGRQSSGRALAPATGVLAVEPVDANGDSRADVRLLLPDRTLLMRNLPR